MTFRSVQAALTSLLFLLFLNHLTGTVPSVYIYKHFTCAYIWIIRCFLFFLDKKTAAVNIREKCMCITEANSLLWRNVKNFRVIDSAPLCNKVQIM